MKKFLFRKLFLRLLSIEITKQFLININYLFKDFLMNNQYIFLIFWMKGII